MKKTIFTTLFLFLSMNFASAQSFNATVNRTTIPEGETFVLTLNLQDTDTKASPDLKQLSNDFNILSVSNGYRTNIVNGDVSKSRQWNLVMIPLKTGNITIPEIELEGFKTAPINLNIIAAGSEHQLVQPQADSSPKFKIKGEIDNYSPYVQQQVNYRLTIYDAGGLQGEAPVFLVSNDDWIIRILGEPRVENKIINGRNLREITFDYAMFAQRSGRLTVPAVKFNGYYLSKDTYQDPFARFFDDDMVGFAFNDVFAKKTPVILTTEPISINVKPAAASTGWWLPAEDLRISAEFEGENPKFKVGEPINRTIYIKAVGVLDSQLPDIKFIQVTGVKQYPEKPIVETKVENNKVVSYAKIVNVYIPEKNGEITLPAIDVRWFNTQTKGFENATIPEYKTVVGSTSKLPTFKIPELGKSSSKDSQNSSLAEVKNTPDITPQTASEQNNIIYIVSAFGFGILITLMLIKITSLLKGSKNNKKSVIAAAKAKDLKLLRDELILWGQSHFPNKQITNLQDIANIFNSPVFNKEIDKIRETLYADNAKDWNASEFIEIFCSLCKQTRRCRKSNEDVLPKLYK